MTDDDEKESNKDSANNDKIDTKSNNENESSDEDELDPNGLDNTKELKPSGIVNAQNMLPTNTAFSISTFLVLGCPKDLFEVHDGKKKIAEKGWHYLCNTNFSFGEHKFEFGLYLTKPSKIMLYLNLLEGKDYHGYLYVQISRKPVMVSPMDQINDGEIIEIKDHVLFQKFDPINLMGAHNYDKYIEMLRENGQIYACVTIYYDHGKNATIPRKLIKAKKNAKGNKAKTPSKANAGSTVSKATKKTTKSKEEKAQQALETLRLQMHTEVFHKEFRRYLELKALEPDAKGQPIIHRTKLDVLWWKIYDANNDRGFNDKNEAMILYPKTEDPKTKNYAVEPLKEETIVRNLLNRLDVGVDNYATYGKETEKDLIDALMDYEVPEKRTRKQVVTNAEGAHPPNKKKQKKTKTKDAAKTDDAPAAKTDAAPAAKTDAAPAAKTDAAAAAKTDAAPAAKTADAAAAAAESSSDEKIGKGNNDNEVST